MAYTLTWAHVAALAPDVAELSLTAQGLILTEVQLRVSGDAWGDFAQIAAIRLAAHLASLSQIDGATGPVASESADGVSVSYAVQATIGLDRTVHGQEYKRLRRIALGPAVMVI